ncbi:tRNA (adenosine(37)-N6)-threonylcarbamoyltransferase complex dimerization subunit type 1 TsaB [Rhodomicrobium lacus]|uniref:tRNA (adenosine(37)-N6)-threonylcarbamoyltransferase complex dimerization subunit type 1 TsaB n=1 Tax=Rhodomicrobium lacus TaxID=2498452 RepID=UPI00247897E4|nr:tRNA (adenosine(37)-N6)-threonylcarbamoyltransferase complex dimerization subunit type 1 TsaB [Rhodomicrobium lacus]
MRVLAIETSMGRTSVAVTTARQGEAVRVKRLESVRGQAEQLIPLIGSLMAEAGLAFAGLDRIAVSVGPGGFSGIRTGVAAARAFGLAAKVPVVGATSFSIMAAAFEKAGHAKGPYGLAAPAGVNAVFCQILKPGREAVTEIVTLPHAECAAFFDGKADVLAGPAATALIDGGFVALPLADPDLFPDALSLAELAFTLNPAHDMPTPFYVRPPDAKPQTRNLIPRKDE